MKQQLGQQTMKKKQTQRDRKEEEHTHSLRLKNRFIIHWRITAGLYIFGNVCCAGLIREKEGHLTEKRFSYGFNCSNNMSQPGHEEDEQMRLKVRDEDLTEARTKLGTSEKAKSKTLEVMEECEKIGKAAPSVFSGVRSGAETVLNSRSARPIKK
ncbi:musculoskeletal embryonic nuclear protein 1a [Clinocottus analis]|uniref:musculoskeletal embryonic nuclear protein 1a n=1 Tax=Clinocottus analis TaxID=304258 RepID=UPI0035BF4C5A